MDIPWLLMEEIIVKTKGVIFEIVRNSFVDGPGVRTTVFFKGCNLDCKWCHNPESKSFDVQMMLYKDKCTHCEKCKDICPNSFNKCNFCGKCAIFCPNSAREICGEHVSSDSVFEQICKDVEFYNESNGGVTFSGGECMLQIDFLKKLLILCKNKSIHTAIDTAGNVPWENFEKILPYTDLFLYDIKLFDDGLHKKYVGTSNKLIFKNLSYLSKTGKNIIIRIPIIGGVNDNEVEMKSIARFLNGLNLYNVELLPYHKLGKSKSLALNQEFYTFETPSTEKLNSLREFFI